MKVTFGLPGIVSRDSTGTVSSMHLVDMGFRLTKGHPCNQAKCVMLLARTGRRRNDAPLQVGVRFLHYSVITVCSAICDDALRLWGL